MAESQVSIDGKIIKLDDFFSVIATQNLSCPPRIFKIRQTLNLPDKDLAKVIRVPKSTLAARKRAGKLSFEESERLYRVQRLLEKAIDVFGDVEPARTWLKKKAYGLGDVSPLELASTEVGAREVENLLGRIEHGIFS